MRCLISDPSSDNDVCYLCVSGLRAFANMRASSRRRFVLNLGRSVWLNLYSCSAMLYMRLLYIRIQRYYVENAPQFPYRPPSFTCITIPAIVVIWVALVLSESPKMDSSVVMMEARSMGGARRKWSYAHYSNGFSDGPSLDFLRGTTIAASRLPASHWSAQTKHRHVEYWPNFQYSTTSRRKGKPRLEIKYTLPNINSVLTSVAVIKCN